MFWAERGCVLQQAVRRGSGRGNDVARYVFCACSGRSRSRIAYAPALAAAGRRTLRRKPQPALPPYAVSGDPEAAGRSMCRSFIWNRWSRSGIDLREHDIKFEEDNWEWPVGGAWGVGWQVMLDGLEITQFTYFQQCGGLELDPICGRTLPTGSNASRDFCRMSTRFMTSSAGGRAGYGKKDYLRGDSAGRGRTVLGLRLRLRGCELAMEATSSLYEEEVSGAARQSRGSGEARCPRVEAVSRCSERMNWR